MLPEDGGPNPTPVPSPASGAGTARPAPVQRATWGWLLALLTWTGIVAYYDLRGGAGLEPTDAWVAQTAREMRENFERDGWSGLIRPQFSNETRLQKSPGPYWAVIGVSYLRGGPVDEVAARIPSGVAALLIVASVFWLTRRMAGDRAAVFAGFACSSSVMILYHSHRAASDLGVAALMTVSLASLWIGLETHERGAKRVGLILLGYFAAGLAMLYKMPMPLACVGIPAVLYVLLMRRGSLLVSGWHLLGMLLFLLPWLPWAIAIVGEQGVALDKWRTEFFDRFTGDLPNVAEQKHDGRLYLLYLGVAAAFAAPYTLSILPSLARPFRRGTNVDRRGAGFVLIWFLSLLAFFTAATGKETRYFLPAMPPLFVLLGIELSAFFDPRRARTPARDRAAATAVILLVPGALVAIGVWLQRWLVKSASVGGVSWELLFPPFVVVATLISVGTIVSALCYARRREGESFAALVAMMYAVWIYAWPNVTPLLASQAEFRDFAAQLRELSAEEQSHLRQIAQQDPRIIWYSDVRFPRLIDQLELLAAQSGRRDPAFEEREYGRRMIASLESADLALFVIGLEHFVRFQVVAPIELAREGRPFPKTYTWAAARLGAYGHRYILFSNQPPPREPPNTDWLSELVDKARSSHDRAGAPAEPIDSAPQAPAATP